MAQSLAMLTQMGMGYSPLAEGIASQRAMPFEGIPGMSGGPMALAGMAMTPQILRMFGESGMIPMGLNHDQNVYDRMMHQRYTMMQMKTMQQASEADIPSYVNTMRGLAAITGTPWGSQQRMAAQSLSRSLAAASPLATELFPELVDQLGGLRGSATVMARRMIDAGRYRIDPVTGRMGMSAETVSAQTKQLYGDLFSDENLHKMQGVTAGQAGSLVQELQMRGMISTQASTTDSGGLRRGDFDATDIRSQVRRAVREMYSGDKDTLRKSAENAKVDISKGVGSLSPDDLDKLNFEPGIAEKLRSFDADKVKRSLKSYVGAVAAMRDIFGDMGHPNAPMRDLMAGLEAMTAGAMSQIDPSRLGMMARQTYNLAKQTGVSMDNAMMLQQHAAQHGQQMGIEPIFAAQATQGALAFGGAYRAQGYAAHPAWGSFNSDQMQQMDANLRIQAASSGMANRLGAAVRMSQTIGGFKEGTDAYKFVKAIESGSSQWFDSKNNPHGMGMSDLDFTKIMVEAKNIKGGSAGFGQGDVLSMIGQTDTNREQVEKYDIANKIVRRAQGTDEIMPFVGARLQETLTSKLVENLMKQGVGSREAQTRAHKASAAVAQKVARSYFEMSPEQERDTASRDQGIADSLQAELAAAGEDSVLQGLNADERRQFLLTTANRFYGETNRAIKGSMFSSHIGLHNMHALHNQTLLNQTDRQQMQAKHTSEMQEDLAPLGHGSMLSRVVEELHKTRDDDPGSFMKVIASAMGGVRIDDINKVLVPHFRKIQDQRANIEDLEAKLTKEFDPEKRAALMAQHGTARRELRDQVAILAEQGQQFGTFTTDSLQHEQVARALKDTRMVMHMQDDLVGLTGGFGKEVTKQQIEAIQRESPEKFSDDDVKAVIRLRQREDIDKVRKYDTERYKLAEMERAKAPEAELVKAREEVAKLKPGAFEFGGDANLVLGRKRNEILKMPQFTGLSEEQGKVMALNWFEANIGNIDKFQLNEARMGFHIRNEKEAAAIGQDRRFSVGTRSTDKEIQEYLEKNPGNTRADAKALLDARKRAGRLGIDETVINGLMGGATGPYIELAVIEEALKKKQEEQFIVTPKQREEYKTAYPDVKAPTVKEMEDFAKNHGMVGEKDEIKITNAMYDKLILSRRQEERKVAMNEFWATDAGHVVREQTDRARQSVEDVASRLVATPHMVQRLGTRAIEMSDTLRAGQQKLEELAADYAGGDMAKLMLKQLNIDTSTKKGLQKHRDVVKTIYALQENEVAVMSEFEEQEGRKGRRFQLGDEGEATTKVIARERAAGNISEEVAAKALGSALSPDMRRKVSQRAAEMGAMENVEEIAGMKDVPLSERTELQRSKLAGIRFGAGNEEEAIGIYGRERWNALGPGEQKTTLDRMRRGVVLRETAIEMLGLKNVSIKKDDDNDQRVEALMVGLHTKEHAKQLLKIDLNKEIVAGSAEEERIQSVMTGIGTLDWARKRMKLPMDERSPELRQKIDREREEVGNREEALRQLKLGDRESLSDIDVSNLAKIRAGMSKEDAMKLFGYKEVGVGPFKIKEPAKYEDLSPEVKIRVDKAVRGVGTVENAAFMADLLDKFNAGELSKDDLKKITRITKRMDSDETAMGVLGKTKDKYYTPEEAAMVKQKAYEIGIARRLSEDDEGKLNQERFTRNRIDKIAKTFKSTPEEMERVLAGGTGGDFDKFKSIPKEVKDIYTNLTMQWTAEKKQVGGVAERLGVAPKDLAGAYEVTKYLQTAQQNRVREEMEPPAEMVKKIMKEYGFQSGTEPDKVEKELAGMLEGQRGQGFGKHVISSARGLREFTAAGLGKKAEDVSLGDIDKLSGEYYKLKQAEDKAGNKTELDKAKADIVEFQKKQGVEMSHEGMTDRGLRTWDKFEQDIQFQHNRGLLKFGATRTDDRDKNAKSDVIGITGTYLQGGERKDGEGDSKRRIDFGGTVKIDLKGSVMDLIGSWGFDRGIHHPGS